MALQFYCSKTREKKPFEPQDAKNVTMYVCGPTVYSAPHIGNARPAVVFDTVYRLLSMHYPNVTYARNITDVDDKINQRAAKEGVGIEVITERYRKVYHQDTAELGCLPPSVEPRATEHIPQMIRAIEALVEKNNAYVSQGHVLFSVPSFTAYGQLSGREASARLAGSRVDVGEYKQHPEDFILWKPAAEDEPGWPSPWGRGRPGWHIECSAMIVEHLGLPIDIHGGGGDLLFPHHENECAQGVCMSGVSTYARYWMHNGMIQIKQEKMSKSLGNILTVRSLLAHAPGEAVRLVLLQTHYRSPLVWTGEACLEQAKRILDRGYHVLERLGVDTKEREASTWGQLPEAMQQALSDDLNTPLALMSWQKLIKQGALVSLDDKAQCVQIKRGLLAAARVLGLLCLAPKEWWQQGGSGVDAAQVETLLDQRREARKARDYLKADTIRQKLDAMGIEIEDRPEGTHWHVKSDISKDE